MFYSETLLQKTGPLAKVWLAANVERKLTKGDCIKTNIEKDVRNIVNTDQAPLALRLTSQLLLGVVRIYSRKARYLLDDCNEALMKIKLAFLPGNVDLAPNQSHVANPAALTLPDTITELDLFAPIPGPDELLFGAAANADADRTVLDWGTSQVLPASLEETDDQDTMLLDDDIDLELEYDAPTDLQADRSVEVGRRAESAQPDRLDNTTVLDLLDEPDVTAGAPFDDAPLDLDMPMMDFDKDAGHVVTELQERPHDAADPRFHRESMSPLSELAPEDEQELERTFQLTRQEDDDDNVSVQAQQRVKRRKVLQNDTTTELNNSQIRAQQDDRSKTLKDPTFLPSDPMLLALMQMQKSGGFVSNILGNERSLGWAPELREVLSLDIVRRAGDLKKRKRSPSPELEEQEHEIAPVDDAPLDLGFDEQPLPADDLPLDDEEHHAINSPAPNFDETTVPLVHPADSGPVSLATKHAVHMLREHFGTEAGEAPSPNARAQQSVMFTDLCPESRTSRADATKLFFETLVLGTKDAIKVEQGSQELGGPIKIRGKRGLWGAWAETGVSQTQTQSASQPAAEVEVTA